MKPLIALSLAFAIAACGGEPPSAQESDAMAGQETAAAGEAAAAVDPAEEAKRQEAYFATVKANFQLSEEQTQCLVDALSWEQMTQQSGDPEVQATITECGVDPEKFTRYAQ